MGYLYGGIACIVLGIILFFVRQSKKKSLFSVLSAPKRSCGEIQEMAKQIAEEIGSGSFNERIKITGKVETVSPLISELANRECVYYQSSVYRKFEDYETYEDSEGKTRERRVTKEELLSSNSNQIPFELNDGSGKIQVNLKGASLDSMKVLDQFVPGESSGSMLSFGSFSFNLGNRDWGRARTLGYRYEEYIIPVKASMLVVGEANDAGGALSVVKPADKDYKYIVSLKSEQEYVSGAKSSIKWLNIFAQIFTLGGAVLAALQFILEKK